MRSHQWIDQRSLALDRAIAEKLRVDPSQLDRVRATLRRWIASRQPAVPRDLLEWQEILDRYPLEEVLMLLRCDDERMRRLRQSSPFCGVLSTEERLAILEEYETLRA